MPHNVKQVAGFKSSTYVEGGVTSGAVASDVAFLHTFTENTTFYYACQPHIAMDMFGEIVVGDGGAPAPSTGSGESEDTPGFMIVVPFWPSSVHLHCLADTTVKTEATAHALTVSGHRPPNR